MEYRTVNIEQLVADAKALGPEARSYLKGLIESEVNGKPKSFLTVRKEYFAKFHPELLPPKKTTRSMRSYLAEL